MITNKGKGNEKSSNERLSKQQSSTLKNLKKIIITLIVNYLQVFNHNILKNMNKNRNNNKSYSNKISTKNGMQIYWLKVILKH
jgi:septum formation topological specificity factor MinE